MIQFLLISTEPVFKEKDTKTEKHGPESGWVLPTEKSDFPFHDVLKCFDISYSYF